MPSLLKPEDRAAVLSALEAQYGGRGTALEYDNAFELLLAVMLSAQTTDKMVNVVTRPLFARYPTAGAIAALTPEELKPWIAKIGLANTKARNVVATCRLLIERHGGEVPNDYEALVALPGVGRKTANVVLSNAFGVPAIPVDTHVFRVANRLGLAEASTVEATEKQLMANVPEEKWAEGHHWLIWHGREICKAPTPKCEQCPLTTRCFYFNRKGQWKKSPKSQVPGPKSKKD